MLFDVLSRCLGGVLRELAMPEPIDDTGQSVTLPLFDDERIPVLRYQAAGARRGTECDAFVEYGRA